MSKMSTKDKGLTASPNDNKPFVISSFSFESGYSYFAEHIPTGEEWYVLGVDVKGDRVCVAGYPPTIAKLSDCKNFEKNKPLEKSELGYRLKKFGQNWI